MSHITTYPLRRPRRYFGQDCLLEKIKHESIEHRRIADENAILRQRIEQFEAIEKLRLAQLDRADMIQTTQRARIDELRKLLIKLNTEYCGEIERLGEVIAKMRTEARQ